MLLLHQHPRRRQLLLLLRQHHRPQQLQQLLLWLQTPPHTKQLQRLRVVCTEAEQRGCCVGA
jgi:hypothetical protein